MKNILSIIMLCVFIISCGKSTKHKKPENLISKDKMAEILIDISLINSAKGINKSIVENNGFVPDAYIYTKHQIDSLQFVLSNEYYTYNINEYQEIISKVSDSLKNLKSKYEILADKDREEKMIQDSIKRSKREDKGVLKEGLILQNTIKDN